MGEPFAAPFAICAAGIERSFREISRELARTNALATSIMTLVDHLIAEAGLTPTASKRSRLILKLRPQLTALVTALRVQPTDLEADRG